jgi:hypothetical protein
MKTMPENNQSIMERRMEALGVNRKPKVEKLPNTLDEGIIEISYLRQLENAARKRMSILYKLHQSVYDHVLELEKQRLLLERLFIPVTHISLKRRETAQYVSPKSREEILNSWKGLPQAEVEKLLKQLEGLEQS